MIVRGNHLSSREDENFAAKNEPILDWLSTARMIRQFNCSCSGKAINGRLCSGEAKNVSRGHVLQGLAYFSYYKVVKEPGPIPP